MSKPPNPNWLNAFVQVGVREGEAWTPRGAGFLFLDHDLAWLVTSRTALEQPGERVAWVGDPGTLVGITQILGKLGLDWVRHDALNLAACPFPVDPAWNVKVFTEAVCLRAAKLAPLLTVYSVGSPYGYELGMRPPVVALDGIVSSLQLEDRILTSAPLLPKNEGGPLLVGTAPAALGGEVLLAGVMSQTMPIRDTDVAGLAPAHLLPAQAQLAVAHPFDAVLALIRSEAAAAQRARARAGSTED